MKGSISPPGSTWWRYRETAVSAVLNTENYSWAGRAAELFARQPCPCRRCSHTAYALLALFFAISGSTPLRGRFQHFSEFGIVPFAGPAGPCLCRRCFCIGCCKNLLLSGMACLGCAACILFPQGDLNIWKIPGEETVVDHLCTPMGDQPPTWGEHLGRSVHPRFWGEEEHNLSPSWPETLHPNGVSHLWPLGCLFFFHSEFCKYRSPPAQQSQSLNQPDIQLQTPNVKHFPFQQLWLCLVPCSPLFSKERRPYPFRG